MNLYGDIKRKIQEKKIFETKENWWTLTAWRENERKVNKQTIKKAIKIIRNEVDQMELKTKTNSKKIYEFRKETEVSQKRCIKVKGGKYLEEALERMLVASYPKLYNQFNILSGLLERGQTRKAIDIVIRTDEKIEEMIELKDWNNRADNPLSATFELLFNYFVYKKISSKKVKRYDNESPPLLIKPLKLTVLAPPEYFKYFNNTGKLELIEKNINKLINSKEINFSFKELPLDIGVTSAIKAGDLNDLDGQVKRKNKKAFMASIPAWR